MKVIESPNIDTWKTECKCSQCTSKLEVESADLKFRVETVGHTGGSGWPDDYWTTKEDFFYITCPMCKTDLEIPKKDIPYLLKQKIKKK